VTIELSPRVPDRERPSDYASLAAEQVNLDNVINELLLRLEDHKYRWVLYGYALTDAGGKSRPIRTPSGVKVAADFLYHPVSGAQIDSYQHL